MELLEKHFEIALETPDGIKKLRELILSLAIQGKLVPQDPKDQPASELLRMIENEKKRLSNENKVKRQSKLSPVMPEEIHYEVPNNWDWVRLSDIGEINPRNNAANEVEAGFVPMPLIFADYGVEHKFEIRKWSEIKNGYTHFADQDVALAKITPCFENGKSCVLKGLPNGIGAGTTELHVFRNTFNAVYPPYLLVYLKNPQYIQLGKSKMTGSAGQKRVPTEYFANNPFPLPPLAEQKRIVKKIDQLISLCDKLEAERTERNNKRLRIHTAAINKLLTALDKPGFDQGWSFITKNFSELYSVPENVEELKKAILRLAVMGKLVAQDPNDQPASELLKKVKAEKELLFKESKIKKFESLKPISMEEIPYNIPPGWIWVRFGEITINRDGERVPISKENRVHIQGTYDYYGASGVIDKINDYIFAKDLLLIGEDGANLINRSTPIAFIAHGKYWVNNHAHVIDTTYSDLLLYLAKYINAIDLKPYVTGTAQPKMNQAKLNSIPIGFPPLAEQKRIVAKIDQLMALCNNLQQHLNESTKKKKAILNGIFAKVQNLKHSEI